MACEILMLYMRVRWALRRKDLPTLVDLLRARAPAPRASVHPVVPYRLAGAVEQLLGSLPADARCLVRSLVLLGLLSRRAVPAVVVIGVRVDSGFSAHAWVESRGRPLLPTGGAEFARLVEL